MNTQNDAPFQVEIADDGSVRISGDAAVHVLWRLVLAAKFQTELNAEHLLSPFVDRLLDELSRIAPREAIDWANPAIETPPGLLEAVKVIRAYRDMHEKERDLADLLQVALKPFDIPAERLEI